MTVDHWIAVGVLVLCLCQISIVAMAWKHMQQVEKRMDRLVTQLRLLHDATGRRAALR
jgi:hypothetical protein